MARPPGDDAPTAESDLVEADTAAFPLRPAGSKADNVYTIGPGTLLAGKYRVERTIGKGGMGIVIEATHKDLDAHVAIKLLLPEFMAYTEASERFMREARAVAKLQSQHVARVLDVGKLDSGEPYMVMEYLDGEDLSRRARARGPFAIGDALDYVVQACDALAEAHARGIVHRDLKPANLFLTKRPDGRPLVKLLDFGVSKILGEGTGEVALTQTTMILGSALYMSPEQMRSAKAVDHRTDIYAIGACLFEMIGGRPPYEAASFPELCAKIYTSPPAPLRELRSEVSEGLVEVLERCIARDPADRYQSVAELVCALAVYACEDTRTAAAAILRQHAPELELPPPAPERARRARGASAVGARRGRGGKGAARDDADRPRRGRLVALLVGAGAIAALGWGALRFGVTGPLRVIVLGEANGPGAEIDASVEVEDAGADTAADADTFTGAAAGADAGAAEDASPATDAGAGTDAAAAKDASADAARASASSISKVPSPAPTGDRRSPGEVGMGLPGAPVIPGASSHTPPPPVNTDLSQETCIAVMPDGSRKSVPCH